MINCIYVHIPFCKVKCAYCAFCSFILLNKKEEYINALIKEINFFYKKNKISTLYFGGGTPSVLEIDELKKILNCFYYDETSSITIEANPLDLTKEKLKEYKKLGINRISIGAQSFDDNILKLIRNHNKNDILNAIENIKSVGFKDYSIDLMYGLPTQTEEIWENTINEAISLNIPHISLYGLKIEPNTKYYKFPPKNLPSLDIQAKMYEKATNLLNKIYQHYEFSNFAKNENFYSRHNISYWMRKNYFGFGLSASGFIDNKRYANTFSYSEYIRNPIKKDYENLSIQQQIEEEIFLGLRLSQGIDFNLINKKYNIDIYKKYKDIFEKYLKLGFFEKTNKGIKLTHRGILLSNEILCDFIEI